VSDFLDAINEGRDSLITGRDVLPSIAVIDECYRTRRRFEMPWFDTSAALSS
jgi:hypothetical protein